MNLQKIKSLLVLALLILPLSAHSQTRAVRIVTIASDSLTSTMRTLSGAQKVILRDNPEAVFVDLMLNREIENDRKIIDLISKNNPTLILTVGSSATQLAKDNFKSIPIVFSAVKYPVLSGFVNSIEFPGGNVTGASIDIPTEIQFSKFKQILPTLKKVGVLYTKNTESLIPQAKIVAQSLAIELIAIKVNSDKELPDALDSLTAVVDGIWSVADHNLFKPQSTRYILVNTLKKGIPFMGFSRNVVESGALFALDFDYKAVGFQAGEIANRVILGQEPKEIKVTAADVIWFHYNEKTSQRINITIPEELAAVAKEVYR